MSTLARVRMEFNCYDVLEVHGSRYVITEKIKYIEIIPKADKEQSYRGQPSMTKSPGDYWHEYGLEAVEGIDKIWLTIEYNDNEWCTVSRTSYHTRPGKGFTLHQIGLEKVVDVDGESGASVGDRAGYREYQLPCEGGASVFFEEEWFDGVLFLLFLFWSDNDLSWHSIRDMFGVPYTAKEHMHDTSAYYTKTDSDSDYVYTSTLDPVSTALDLIDSVNGDIKNERDNLEEGHEVIVFYSGDLVYLITNTDGQTRVKVCEQSKLTQENWKIIDRTLISSHMLDNYATMVRLGDNTGRERLYPTSNSNNTSNTKLYY